MSLKIITSIGVIFACSSFAADSQQPVGIPGIDYHLNASPTPSGPNPLLSNTKVHPDTAKPRRKRLPVDVRGGAHDNQGGGSVKAPVGSF